MSGFQFPPPPPPPPKPSDWQVRDGYAAPQRGQVRGRARGGSDRTGQRGRGGRQSFENGGEIQQCDIKYGSIPATASSRPYLARANPEDTGHSSVRPFDQQFNVGLPARLPPGAFVNPAFRKFDSKDSTPALSTFNYSGHGNASRSPDNAANPRKIAQTGSPQRTSAGHKRKLDALRGPQPVVKKSDSPTAPAIPSFGTSILPQKLPAHNEQNSHSQSRSTNMLGLTPLYDDPQYSSENDEHDEDVDEEAVFSGLGANLTFEHNGLVMSLNTAADLAAWKEERRKQFPTKQRMAARLEEKRRLGEERSRLLEEANEILRGTKEPPVHSRKGKAAIHGPISDAAQPNSTKEQLSTTSKMESDLEKVRREFREKNQQLEALRRRVVNSQARALVAASARDQDGKADAEATAVAEDANATGCMDMETEAGSAKEAYQKPITKDKAEIADIALAETGVAPVESDTKAEERFVRSASPSDISSSSSSDTDSEPPEETTSKAPQVEPGSKQALCKYFTASGRCRDGDACRFKHVTQPLKNANRASLPPSQQAHHHPHSQNPRLGPMTIANKKSIYDRLLEQEQNEEDQLAVQAIKWLGSQHFFAQQKVHLDRPM